MVIAAVAAFEAGDLDTVYVPVGQGSGICGTILAREYKGQVVQVTILPTGIDWDGTLYQSLSPAAKAITGSHVNGFQFSRLTDGGRS